MKKELLRRWSIGILLIGLMNGTIFYSEAAISTDNIDFKGRWDDDKRSVPSELPISAFVDGSVLMIQSSTANVDIMIVVSQNGIPIYERTILASQTSQIVIDMSGWDEGTYVLVLRNKWGGVLSGEFSKSYY